MLLNDLTEVAWSHLARKSTNKITAPTQTRLFFHSLAVQKLALVSLLNSCFCFVVKSV